MESKFFGLILAGKPLGYRKLASFTPRAQGARPVNRRDPGVRGIEREMCPP